MLTLELLKKESSLQGLTDEQLSAIATLSKNDEEAVFGAKFSALHNELDESIKSVTGKSKAGTEKTSDYLKRVLGEQKTDADALTAKVTELESVKAELEGKITQGSGDKELIESQKATIADITGKYNTLKAEKDKMEAEHQAALLDMRIGTELSSALGELKFKSDANEEVLSVLKAQAVNAVKGLSPSYIKDDKGAERLVFKDANGAEMRNPDNQLAFYTAKELLVKELTRYGVVDDGKSIGGGGGKENPPRPSTNIAGAKTRVEANEIIQNQVASAGFVRGSKEYQAEVDRISSENAEVIAALPFK